MGKRAGRRVRWTREMDSRPRRRFSIWARSCALVASSVAGFLMVAWALLCFRPAGLDGPADYEACDSASESYGTFPGACAHARRRRVRGAAGWRLRGQGRLPPSIGQEAPNSQPPAAP